MKTKTIFKTTASLLAMFVIMLFAFNACSKDDSDSEPILDSDPVLMKLNITEIAVIRFKNDNMISVWDPPFGKPDIYPRIDFGNTIILDEDAHSKQNIGAVDLPVHFNINPPVDLLYLDKEYVYKLYDDDDGFINSADDFMGSLSFVPINEWKPGALTISLSDNPSMPYAANFQVAIYVTPFWE
jgi:hypothetical protein